MIKGQSSYVGPGRALSPDARLVRMGLGLALAAAVGSILLWQSAGTLLPACLFREITGVSCLTCGLTRSLEAASHGNVLAALRFHLLGPFILAGMVMACIGFVAEAFAGRSLGWFSHDRWQRRALTVVAAIWILYGMIRAIAQLL